MLFGKDAPPPVLKFINWVVISCHWKYHMDQKVQGWKKLLLLVG